MLRIMVLTFGFLTWGWYELSGGSEFVAGTHGVQMLASMPEVKVIKELPDTSAVTRTAADLTSMQGFATKAVRVSQPVETSSAPVIQVAHLSQKPMIRSDAPVVIQVAARDVAALRAEEPVMQTAVAAVDYRRVNGKRVNLRGGPSTGFDVVTQLLRGEEVEILQDDGEGWVELRALDGNDIGWMSDKFLTRMN